MKQWFIVLAIAAMASAGVLEERIVGGSVANESQFPHQVSLRRFNSHFCGGAIISERYIVTAAHCLKNFVNNTEGFELKAVVGTNNLDEDATTVSGDEYDVEKAICHEDYLSSRTHDIGLVKVKTDIKFSQKVQKIEIYPYYIPDGYTITVSGWGRTSTNGPLSQKLLYLDVTIQNLEECRKIISSVADSEMCITPVIGQGACFGDSGGPLVVFNSRMFLVAVVSHTYGGCGSNLPDVHTRTDSHIDWIKSNMDEK